ncbi:biotin--[acetyl-CoA-carboxylase] ligase [Bradyrhizobium sp. LHD-71]|uniref:biotin--[acetyl-CoA-carboxylase] ligase n=1 Tax=Bradyrhizobium sp. LHD-71 TaxID=3072141 RepID=UPI00280F3DF6|nr:biotin--[acetyl-CoA-carboxylase] ligase [Bradyrhizobium sp. LHD-71]MDQ8728752.1 biotin--[acetyl-CoA-carboxylase] ligase [Bradyrhizobium sp. LHD-71]
MAFALGSKAQSAGYRLLSFDSIGSTNAEGLARAKAGETGPLWLVTDHQVSGRGRRNRAWISPRGNLAASVLEVMAVQPAVAATLGFAAGVALAEALRSLGVEAEVKWPNDVLLHGAKLSGILLEAESLAEGRMAVVTGIGVNVVGAPQGVPYAATSLADAGTGISAERLFAALSDRWAEARQLWDAGRGMAGLRSKWLACAAGVGRPVTIQVGGQTVAGTFETIDESGHLIVATADGRRVPIASGEVFFGDAGSKPAGAA